jgi:hypothetical protein
MNAFAANDLSFILRANAAWISAKVSTDVKIGLAAFSSSKSFSSIAPVPISDT